MTESYNCCNKMHYGINYIYSLVTIIHYYVNKFKFYELDWS